jgi:hypothetical protein
MDALDADLTEVVDRLGLLDGDLVWTNEQQRKVDIT